MDHIFTLQADAAKAAPCSRKREQLHTFSPCPQGEGRELCHVPASYVTHTAWLNIKAMNVIKT